ncbi:MAG: hypothetical protein J0I77_05235 [Rudaea sp.]|uniref:hypothetical protein n=1 Tax=unclassified Rudaea TaxID=2627037 RepID=UPI0010F4B460|nr:MULTISPECIES: hypothetical protein [unclassified Rudaea]MBN8885101.1 hypothetical protein [Rudaea sp.]MBR0344780.1 hypothetical protein [Rudaea sp.]
MDHGDLVWQSANGIETPAFTPSIRKGRHGIEIKDAIAGKNVAIRAQAAEFFSRPARLRQSGAPGPSAIKRVQGVLNGRDYGACAILVSS